jgi:hypothetical protein
LLTFSYDKQFTMRGAHLFVAAVLLLAAVSSVQATSLRRNWTSPAPVLKGCELPPPEDSTTFWINLAGSSASALVSALGYESFGEAISKFTETAADWTKGDPPTEFSYVSCMLQQIDHKLDLILQGLDEIKELIVTVVVKQQVQNIQSSFQTLQYIMEEAPYTKREALDESMYRLYEGIIQHNFIYESARTIHDYLTTSPSEGTDPLFVSLSKNHAKDSMIEYYVHMKQDAAYYWDTLGMAANLLRYAAQYRNLNISGYLRQAKEIEAMIPAQGIFIEDGDKVIIPNLIRDLSRTLLNDTKGIIHGTMKMRVARGGFGWVAGNRVCRFVDKYCFSSGRRVQYTETLVRFTRTTLDNPHADWASLYFEVSTDHGANFYPVGMDRVVQKCQPNFEPWSLPLWGIMSTNPLKLYAILPSGIVDKDYKPDHYLMSEMVGFKDGRLQYTCSKFVDDDMEALETCRDPVMSDRSSYEEVADDEDCWFDAKWDI